MSSRCQRAVKPAEIQHLPLRVNDLLFINEYFRNGQNATQAYRMVHPHAKYSTAETNSRRVLGKARVREEIVRRVQVEGGVTREFVESSLLKYQSWAETAQDYEAAASIVMDAAKLAGLITEKREVKTITDEDRQAVRELVRSHLVPAPN